ncbi:PAS domain S-box protein [Solidesulfovibrio sp.]|uniref:sensor histidine kinase n=1 Tax=Solidesulfovibrio sp. TaxID=2910990 RepID=UPI002B20595D|nr:PAS domain S-box protein [Solidesulfovibrio sp.]MEA4858102.1 PAS domain S-box protein [Solidesulfovibrio sp.]
MIHGLGQRAKLVVLALLAASVLVVPASWLLWHVEARRFDENRRAEISSHLGDIRLSLRAALDARLAFLRAIAAFAASDPGASPQAFAAFAASLVEGVPGIRSLQLARDGVVSHVFPETGNDGILGLDLVRGLPSAQRKDLLDALRYGRAVVTPPVDLLQGGQGLIAREPVFPAGPGPKPARLWGLATVIIDAGTFFGDLRLASDGSLRLAIREQSGDDSRNALVFGDPAVFDTDPETATMPVPGGDWLLAAAPSGGWSGSPPRPSLVAAAGCTWLALGAVFFVFLSWPARLSRAVSRATAALDTANADLERTVAARTAALTEANTALRLGEARYRAFIDATRDMAFIKDAGLRYVVVNRLLAEFFGRTPGEVTGRTDYELVPAVLAARCHESDLAARDGGEVVTLRETVDERTLEVRKFPVPLDGGVMGVGGYIRDISDRLAAERALRQSEEALRLLWAAVDQSPASIVITDPQGVIEYVNPHFSILTGYTPEEARGLTPRVLKSGVHPEAFYREMWETLVAGRIWRGELCNRKKNGDLYWEDSSISPVRDDAGAITHFVAVKEDITDRRQREDRLRLLMSEFEAIFNASSVGIVHLGADERVVRANRRFGELFGLDPEDLAGRALADIHDGSTRLEVLRRELLAKVAAGGAVQAEERLRTSAGRTFWCSLHGRRIDPDSPASGSIWIFDDVSARKELEAVREDVERIMRHDLKAPLNSIVNLPGLVMAVGEVNEEQQEMLAEIERAGHVMLEQIELSLDLYRMETATYVLTAQRVDMARIVSGVAEMLAKTARARGVAVSVEAEGPVFALGDALLCQTIAANLLKNAIEAEPPGSAVTVRVAGQGERVVFTVANPAMVPEDIAPVFFEKYTTGGKKGGSGLGAYSARLMTLCQHGAIRMETSPETGTLVEVSLPMG